MSNQTTTDAAPRLAARGIVRAYGEATVLDGVDLVRERPGVIGLLGANGAGKTTLLRILAQLMLADEGAIDVGGRIIDRGDDHLARRAVGWAPHEALAWRDDSVQRNLRYAARLGGLSKRQASVVADAAIQLWGLDEEAATPVRRLSRGWAQRYSLARADLFAPPLLLLDEPTTGLDAKARRLLEDAIAAWRRDRIVVIASHERDWLTDCADQLLDLDEVRR